MHNEINSYDIIRRPVITEKSHGWNGRQENTPL